MSEFSCAESTTEGHNSEATKDGTDHHEFNLAQQDDAITEEKAEHISQMEKLQSSESYGRQINRCRKDTDTHLESIRSEVDSAILEEMKRAKGREQEEDAKIDQEIDEKNQKLEEKIGSITCIIGKNFRIRKVNEEIRKNNEDRELRQKHNHANTEIIQEAIANRQLELHADIEAIAEEIERKICELGKSWQDDTKTTMGTIRNLGELPADGENVKDGQLVGVSGNAAPQEPLDENGVDYIIRTVSRLKFMTAIGRKKYGRIDGYDGEWSLVDTISITNQMAEPSIVGCVDDSVIIVERTDNGDPNTYALDVQNKHNQRVVTGDCSSLVSCALLSDDKIVCGNYCDIAEDFKGESLTGLISVYDRQWKLIKNDFIIPRDGARWGTSVDIAVDQNGMIIAGEGIRPIKIYVINPADGKINRTIGVTAKDVMMRGVLSSGHIIAHSWVAFQKVLKIDHNGPQREISLGEFHRHDDIRNICIDPLTDSLYVVSSDDLYSWGKIDQVMIDSDMTKRRVGSYRLSDRLSQEDRKRYLRGSSVVMTSTGKIVACNGDNIIVFKKLFKL
eukprot:XP_011661101.1 PREDICTED: uncharacterized protein LOC105436811 [Strongylocentrotus purpuratus]